MKPTLFILAAGMGSRYGGLKQLDGLGPSGETIMDYSVFDALRAGFGKIVFVIRHDFEQEFREKIISKYEGHVPVEVVFQDINTLPEGFKPNPERTQPWGTNHAVMMAKDVVKEPFAVINGDDYYGKESFKVLADWFNRNAGSTGKYTLVGFELDKTLSESGTVSRGIGSADSNNLLTHVEEHHDIIRREDGKIHGTNSKGEEVLLADKALCSMNMWGFTPDYFANSEEIFRNFLAEHSTELKSEFYIPYVVDCLIKAGKASCELISTPSRWFGVTYQADRQGVVDKFQEFADKGIYPSPLYE